MKNYLAAIWGCRYFWLSLVKIDLSTRYRRSFLGLGWSLLQPVAMTATICLALNILTGEPIVQSGPYVMSGLVAWNFLLTCALQGCRSLYNGETYIRQYPAPMAIYPLRTVLAAMVHFLIALSVVLVLSWVLRGFTSLSALLSLLPGLVVLFLIGWSLALLAGFANVYFQDTQHLCEIGFQILFYATPILYRAEILEKRGLGWIASLNPAYNALELVRRPIEAGEVAPLPTLAAASITTLATLALAALTLRRHEHEVIFRL